MNLENWTHEYTKIVQELGLDREADIISSKQFASDLTKNFESNPKVILLKLSEKLKMPSLIAGAGPSIENDFLNTEEFIRSKRVNLIAVNGTCSLFYQHHVIPDIIVTDLDGEWTPITWAIQQGAITLVHAHGDNQKLIEQFFQKYRNLKKYENIWGTTQNIINTTLFNFGGFTDGDRAIFTTFWFQTPIIGLIGFDFGNKVGNYSMLNPLAQKDLKRKLKKFEIAIRLIGKYHQEHTGKRYNLTSQGEEIPGFTKISFKRFNLILENWYKKSNTEEFPTQ